MGPTLPLSSSSLDRLLLRVLKRPTVRLSFNGRRPTTDRCCLLRDSVRHSKTYSVSSIGLTLYPVCGKRWISLKNATTFFHKNTGRIHCSDIANSLLCRRVFQRELLWCRCPNINCRKAHSTLLSCCRSIGLAYHCVTQRKVPRKIQSGVNCVKARKRIAKVFWNTYINVQAFVRSACGCTDDVKTTVDSCICFVASYLRFTSYHIISQ